MHALCEAFMQGVQLSTDLSCMIFDDNGGAISVLGSPGTMISLPLSPRRVLGLRIEERPAIWRVAANILKRQSRTADIGWSSI
jgi:hypothetical protein